MKTKFFLVCSAVLIMATSLAMAGGNHGGFGGGFAGAGSFHGGGNWNHCNWGHSSFVFIGGFPFFGYPYGYGYYPYGYGYYPYGYPYGYGGGYYGYGSGYYGYGNGYGNSYYGNGYYGNRYYGDNSHQSSVARLQRQLAHAGYYRGAIDGIMGPRTRYALRAYEHDHGTASL